MDLLIRNITSSLATGKMISPSDLAGLGVKNIHHYREKFARVIATSKASNETIKIVFQLLMSVKNRKRIIDGIKLSVTLQSDPDMKLALAFLESYVSQSTRDQTDSKMPAVKIPDSFPEICAGFYVTVSILRGISNVNTIVDELLNKPWLASLALNPELQAINKEAVREMWDSWGKTAGTKTNNAGEVLKFDEAIYSNSEEDKIQLVNYDGTFVSTGTNGYDRDTIKEWVKDWATAISTRSVQYIGSKSQTGLAITMTES